jgi:acetolactate synthase-1/2/3 large subunit
MMNLKGETMKLSGSKIILETLKENNVDILFGYPGGAVIPLFDALYDEMDYFTNIRTAHEQHMVHAADAYARTTGKVGVAIATSGPGATNTVTGIANAYMDSVPLVVITGQVPNMLLGKDSFQEVDITGMTLPITKHNYLVRKVEDLAYVVDEALRVAAEGRPGPVLVDVPKDVFLAETEYVKVEKREEKKDKTVPSKNLIQQAVKLINESKKPVVYAGGGVRISKNDELLQKLVEKNDLPTANSFMGFGTIPREHRLSLGLVGMHGHRETNLAVTESDLIIAVGARFSDRVIGKPDEFAPKAKIIHIDIDDTEVDKNTKDCVPLIGDMKSILELLYEKIEENSREDWLQSILKEKAEEPKKDEFVPKNIIEKVNEYFKEDTIVATDVGQHQMWTGQFWKFKKSNEFVTSGGLGTMGFGLGAAIGAQVGNPDKNVVLVTGDASFRMNAVELLTVSRYKLPIRMVMLNNHALGMVRQWQRMFSNSRYSETDTYDNVDNVKLMDAYGIKGYKINTIEELDKILDYTKELKEAVFIECLIDNDESVYPIVPPGRPINELLLNG